MMSRLPFSSISSAFPARTLALTIAVVLVCAWSRAEAGSALWYGSNFDTVHDKSGDDVAAISGKALKKSGVANRVSISEEILANAMGVAFDQGNLWVTTEDNHLYEFTKKQIKNLSKDPSPVPAADITSMDFQFILGCAFDSHGNLWVLDTPFNGIHEISAAQLAAGTASITPAANITSPSFASPAFATFDGQGNLWVSSTDNSVLAEFNAANLSAGGNLTADIVIQGDSLKFPGEIQFDSQGNLWVPNSGNNTVVEFTKDQITASGSPRAAVILSSTTVGNKNTINVPWGMTFDNSNNLWVYSYFDDETQTEGALSKFTKKLRKTSGSPAPAVFLTGIAPYSGEQTFGTAPK